MSIKTAGVLRALRVSLWVAPLLGSPLGLTPALAATAPAGQQASPDESDTLDAVVVTAQKRTERLQDVPVSVEVVSAERLAQKNLVSLYDISQTDPSIRISRHGLASNLYIRGTGSAPNQSFEQSVGLFVDDIYHGRSRISGATFLDLERVEVLKGPQSTFFGNNAIAGALNIVTQKPTFQFDAWARTLYGQFGQYAVEGAIGGPLSDTVALRVAATANGASGWVENVTSGSHMPDRHNAAGRMSLLFRPTDDLDATLKFEASRNRNTGLYVSIFSCPPPAPFTTSGYCAQSLAAGWPVNDLEHIAANPGIVENLDTTDGTLTVNYQRWGHTFTSVSGFYDYDYYSQLDLDSTPLTMFNFTAPERSHQFSQELRVASPLGQTLEYLAGLYYQHSSLFYQSDQSYFFLSPADAAAPTFSGLAPYLPLGQRTSVSQPESTYSAFASVTLNATDRLKISADLRASRVLKSVTRDRFYGTATQDYGAIDALPDSLQSLAGVLINTPAGVLTGSRTDDAWMPSARLQYQLASDAMAYFSYTKGFKAGGFNGNDTTGLATNLPFAPEHVNAYEAGLKSAWLNGRWVANLAVFHSEYADLQVARSVQTAQGNVTSIVQNAATSRAQGVELEVQGAVGESLRLAMAATYLHSRYGIFQNVALTQLQTLCRSRPAEPLCTQDYPGGVGLTQDLSGTRTAFAPTWSGHVTAAYSWRLPQDYRLTTELSSYLTSDYYRDVLDRWTGAYAREDARISLETADRRGALDIIVKNFTDRDIITHEGVIASTPGSVSRVKAEPRNIAAQIRYRW